MENAAVNFGASKLTVFGAASVEELKKAGAFDGIKVIPEKEKVEAIRQSFWQRRSNVRFAISAALLLLGWGIGIQTGESGFPGVLPYAAAIVIGGYKLFIKGFRNLTRFRFDMNTLMTIAILGAAAIGEWGEGAVVVLLFAISEALESYSMDKARQSIRSLMNIAPKEATVRRSGIDMTIPVDELEIGDVMVIKPGQRLAMDGTVVAGYSTVNQAAITGESIPVSKCAGDDVFAGTLNEEGVLEVEVTKRSEDTTIAKIIHLVEEAQAERAPSQAFVDRFAKYYTPAIMLLALGTILVPPLFFNGDWNRWIYEGLALLVVGCPCALVMSTPVAIVTAIGNAARNGVLMKGGIHLEEMGALNVIAFDKTGTLTKGRPEVTDIVAFSGRSDQEILEIAAAIEQWSNHPLAAAVVRKAKEGGGHAPRVSGFSSITGKGVKAVVEGAAHYIGSPKLFADVLPGGMEQDVTERILALQQQGKTAMLLGNESGVLGIIAVADQVRENSVMAIRKLREAGIKRAVMLTGDNRAAAEAIGARLGIDEIRAELLPQEKLAAIKQLQAEHGKVAMVGDGINDAPALAAAAVGIAMGGAGTDTALETADIALMGDDLAALPYTIRLSRRTLGIIKENITFSLAVKLLAVLLIIPQWLTLWIAVFADMGATLIVIANSLRLARTKKK